MLVDKGRCSVKNKSVSARAMGGWAVLTPALANGTDIEDNAQGSTVPTLHLSQGDWDTLKKWVLESESGSQKADTPKPRVMVQVEFEMVGRQANQARRKRAGLSSTRSGFWAST